MRLEAKEEALQFFPLSIILRSPALSKPLTAETKRRQTVTGFTLNWFLEDGDGTRLTEMLPAREKDWELDLPTPDHEQSLLMANLVVLARQLRLQNMTDGEMLVSVIHKKIKQIELLKAEGTCSMEQVQSRRQNSIFSTLTLELEGNSRSQNPPSHEEIKTAHKLFYANVFCPTMPFKLFRFIDQLLSSERSRTVIQSVVNLLQPEVLTDETSITMVRQFYSELTTTLNLQHGNVLLATSLQSEKGNDLRSTQLIKCQQDSCFHMVQDILQNLGIFYSTSHGFQSILLF